MEIAAHTLGCKLNSAETSTIVGEFRARGWDVTRSARDANVYLLNTCSVTANAERECRQIVRRVLRENPSAFIAVTGCYAQLRPEEIASIEGVDVVLGAKEKFDLFSYITSFEKLDAPKIFSSPIDEVTDFHLAATSDTSERTRAFLKVQDGCDYTCSYCTIPMARGTSRSTKIEDILHEARRLCADGFLEIVLSGVNVGDYGASLGLEFVDLVRAIENDDKITARIRISSIEPNLLTDEIIDIVAHSSKFCPHFHIPMQSGSDKILRLMQRRYTAATYRERIEKVKQAIPDCGIGVDVIVGFPGETEEDFDATYQFLADLEISYLHVFSYSERPDTKAASMSERVSKDVRKLRNERLRMLSEKKRQSFYRTQLGSTRIMLIEDETEVDEHGAVMTGGFTENYVRVSISQNKLPANALALSVRLDRIGGESVLALPVEILEYRSEEILLPILQ
ncbi:MAG TPA: tRNA (N(6)-L-threonylcarbamoyladenosine(37)-C(2))-methylthiotransferase MtaB [Candidatus Kapabacteria bacterium]|nr:tRNA (N(6)-L-threonylcarbamoyladenosine(37)-C(2))-methylthiotransferase MtaB [Candidatus Kapabacteria bacterium]